MTRRSAGKVLLLGSGCIVSLACAQTPAAATGAAGGPVMSLVISTAAVIALIVGAAWLLKRMAPRADALVGPRARPR